MALQVKMVADSGVYGHKFLQTSHAPEMRNDPFSSSKRLVRIFCPVVRPATRILSVGVANGFHGGTIGT